MNIKLSAKIQKLNPKLNDLEKILSHALSIEPDNTLELERKGSLFAVFEIVSQSPVDTLLATKIINDVLRDSYYKSENSSPIQALEKAIIDVKERVLKIPKESGKDKSTEIDFSVIAAVLWGNVLYLAQYGRGGNFLIRDAQVKSINSSTEGHFSVASGVVKNEDVVILGTKDFVSMEDFVNRAGFMSSHDLPLGAAAIILKFIVDTAFSEAEVLDFGSRSKPLEKPKKVDIKLRVPKKKLTKSFMVLALIFLALLFIESVLFTSKSNKREDKNKEEAAGKEEVKKENTGENDEKHKIRRVDSEAFYDLKIADETANPESVVILDNHVVVTNRDSGFVYVSGIVTPKFVAEKTSFPGINSLNYFGGDLSFVDKEGFKVYSVSLGKVKESAVFSGLGISAPYLDFVYSLVGDTITKYEKVGGKLEGDIWAKDQNFSQASSIAIDGDIYVLKGDGNLYSYTRGEKNDFKIEGLDKPLSSPVQVVTNPDMKNIYIADRGNNRIVVLDKEGKLISQYVEKKEDRWKDMRGIGVSVDEKVLYILDGSRVYKFDL